MAYIDFPAKDQSLRASLRLVDEAFSNASPALNLEDFRTQANNNSRIGQGLGQAARATSRSLRKLGHGLAAMPWTDGEFSTGAVVEMVKDIQTDHPGAIAAPVRRIFRKAGVQVAARLARGVREGLKPQNLLSTAFSSACIYSSFLGFEAAMADPLITVKVAGGLGSVVGGASATFLLFSMRGAKSPYEGTVWKTFEKSSTSPDASTDYFMRAWSFPMAIVTHSSQLVNAVAFKRYEQLGSFLLGLPGEILSFTGMYRQARRTKAVEQGREPANVAAQKKTMLGKTAAIATEALVSPFGGYLTGRAIDVFQWMDASGLADPQVVDCKHHAIKVGTGLATIGLGFWFTQRYKGLGSTYIQDLAQGVKNAARNTGTLLRDAKNTVREITPRTPGQRAGMLLAASIRLHPEPAMAAVFRAPSYFATPRP